MDAAARLAEHIVGTTFGHLPHDVIETTKNFILIMKVRLKDGRTYDQRVDAIKGHPLSPMTREERLDKLRRCAAHAAPTIPEARLNRAIELVEHLEEVKDVGDLAGSLTA